jgi:hypothetical protein
MLLSRPSQLQLPVVLVLALLQHATAAVDSPAPLLLLTQSVTAVLCGVCSRQSFITAYQLTV